MYAGKKKTAGAGRRRKNLPESGIWNAEKEGAKPMVFLLPVFFLVEKIRSKKIKFVNIDA